jgi:hypothetical protein
MFIYTARASTVRYFAVIALCLILLFAITFIGSYQNSYLPASAEQIRFSGIKTNDDRLAFIERFGIKVKENPTESVEFSVPRDFDRIILGYNEIQKAQGLDISRYKNKRVTRYTYEAVDYEGYDGTVCVNLIIYRNTVVACDISSNEKDGFVKPLVKF